MATKHYQVRKQLRVKLHAKRCEDNDQFPARYQRDARVLNRAMAIFNIKGDKASWQTY